MNSNWLATRTLYKAFTIAARRLNKEVKRHQTLDIFSNKELEWIKTNIPEFISAVKGGDNGIREFIRNEFKSTQSWFPEFNEEQIEKRLDLGFSALSLFSKRISLLEQQASDPFCNRLSNGVRVTVESELKFEDGGKIFGYLYKYKVKIVNEEVEQPVQLISRHWIISDSEGRVEEVSGPGVVGQQPILKRGMEFEYASMTPLPTKRGTMKGTYHMIGSETLEPFDVEVGPFALCPNEYVL